ncbi:MAG: DNA polymerase III subunit beta [Sphingomonadaceae bacterium]
MKLLVERANVLKALGHVQSVVERRNTIPILSNVLLSAEGDGLKLMATDLDLQVVEEVPANVETAGATTVSAHTLYDIIRKIPDGAQVTLDASGPRMSVVAGRARFQLQTLPREDFPVIGESELPVNFSMPAETLRTLIDKTRFAISTEETRYYLNGIFLHAPAGQQTLRAVATDGHRLARYELPLPAGAADMPDIIIPRKCVAEVRKLLDERDEDIGISLSAARIRFQIGGAVLTSKLIDGTFPDYSRVIPTGNDRILKIDPATLAEGVDRVTAIASEKTRAVKLSLDQDRVTLSVTSPENGTASEDIPADYAAGALDVGFNSRYLLDILQQIDSDEVEVHLADAVAPTLIREVSQAEALYVLMPMRV